MESEDGHVFIKNLAQFIHAHEQALASALQSRHRSKKSVSSDASSSISSLADVLTRPFASLTTSAVKPAKLSLTPHHLYFLLSKFEELGVNVGALNVRLENIHTETHANYVSFLGQAPKRAGRGAADTDSLKSVSSMRSVMSNVSSIWSSFRSSSREEKRLNQHREDLKYLYSCFTKLPALRLAPDSRTRLIAGYEAFPFDTAVPIHVLKNVSYLEICDLDFRQIYGWHTLSRQLRSLTVRHAHLEDPLDVLLDIVLDDLDGRRKRSSKAPVPTTPSTPGGSWVTSPRSRHGDLATNAFSSYTKQRSGSLAEVPTLERSGSSGRPGSGSIAVVNHTLSEERRSSSQGSSIRRTNSRQKSVDVIGTFILPSSAWQFLRHLSLADNGLHHVSVASLAPVASTLQSLDLSSNLFSEVPEALASLSQLRQLNLSNCMIESLRSLARSPLPAITVLNVRSNRIQSLAGIEKLYSLEKIDLRDNGLADPAELARLTGIPYMSHVYIAKNPFTKTHLEHRIAIFNLFRSVPERNDDIIIDQIGPMFNEKRKLVDWAPVAPTVAVIKAATEDEPKTDVADDTPLSASKRVVDLGITSVELDSPTRRKRPPRVAHIASERQNGTSNTPNPRISLDPSDKSKSAPMKQMDLDKPLPASPSQDRLNSNDIWREASSSTLEALTLNKGISVGTRTLG